MDRLDEALWVAENGQKIFIEAGPYTVSKSGSSHYVSGKNVSLEAASTKDCALLFIEAVVYTVNIQHVQSVKLQLSIFHTNILHFSYYFLDTQL